MKCKTNKTTNPRHVIAFVCRHNCTAPDYIANCDKKRSIKLYEIQIKRWYSIHWTLIELNGFSNAIQSKQWYEGRWTFRPMPLHRSSIWNRSWITCREFFSDHDDDSTFVNILVVHDLCRSPAPLLKITKKCFD